MRRSRSLLLTAAAESNGSFEDYSKAVLIQAPFEILDKYGIDYVLLQSDQPLTYLLEHSPAWRPIYTDKVAVLLERIPATAVPLKAGSN